jgi:hypothetical protein
MLAYPFVIVFFEETYDTFPFGRRREQFAAMLLPAARSIFKVPGVWSVPQDLKNNQSRDVERAEPFPKERISGWRMVSGDGCD